MHLALAVQWCIEETHAACQLKMMPKNASLLELTWTYLPARWLLEPCLQHRPYRLLPSFLAHPAQTQLLKQAAVACQNFWPCLHFP